METKWWHNRVIYQIYPRSFSDSNGDGIGDIPGIIAKLDYLKSLGIGAIWLSPVYTSPNRDMGYDVADYCAINPEYGTLDDMKLLISESKARDIKVIMDLVLNHTSDQHTWFQSSRDPKSPYRDYYIWQKPQKGFLGKEKPPNNWTSFFTGPAWTKDEKSGEYYLHLFTKQQPDLNYRNPKVIEEMMNIMRFWLDLGVAGFRCDVINLIYKQSFVDGKKQLLGTGSEHYISTQGAHQILQQFYREVWKPYNAFIVGEIHMDHNLDSSRQFIQGNELSTTLTFEHMIFPLLYKPSKTKQALIKWQQGLDWNSVFFENHDGWRSVSRLGSHQKYHYQSATMLATLLLTLRGTPFIYQGQEIGMTNAPFSHINQLKDIVSLSVFKLLTKVLIPSPLAFKLTMYVCRDHARTPMQWDDTQNAGFTSGQPWLMVNPNYQQINVAKQDTEANSVFKYYRQLLQLRHDNEALQSGEISFTDSSNQILIYDRFNASNRFRIIANLSANRHSITFNVHGKVVFSNYNRTSLSKNKKLEPFEALLIQLPNQKAIH